MMARWFWYRAMYSPEETHRERHCTTNCYGAVDFLSLSDPLCCCSVSPMVSVSPDNWMQRCSSSSTRSFRSTFSCMRVVKRCWSFSMATCRAWWTSTGTPPSKPGTAQSTHYNNILYLHNQEDLHTDQQCGLPHLNARDCVHSDHVGYECDRAHDAHDAHDYGREQFRGCGVGVQGWGPQRPGAGLPCGACAPPPVASWPRPSLPPSEPELHGWTPPAGGEEVVMRTVGGRKRSSRLNKFPLFRHQSFFEGNGRKLETIQADIGTYRDKYLWTVGGSRSTRRKSTQTQEQHANSAERPPARTNKSFKYTCINVHPPTYHLFLAIEVFWDNYGGGHLWTLLQGLAFHSITLMT